MAKTNEEFQQELAQLFVRAGEAQFMSRMYKVMIQAENDKLNGLNQKIENLQKQYRTFLSQTVPSITPKPAEATASVVEASSEQASPPESA